MIPKTRVIKVKGSPTFRYSKKPIFTSSFADSKTMIFATEPIMVKFPASVDDIANVSQRSLELARLANK